MCSLQNPRERDHQNVQQLTCDCGQCCLQAKRLHLYLELHHAGLCMFDGFGGCGGESVCRHTLLQPDMDTG